MDLQLREAIRILRNEAPPAGEFVFRVFAQTMVRWSGTVARCWSVPTKSSSLDKDPFAQVKVKASTLTTNMWCFLQSLSIIARLFATTS